MSTSRSFYYLGRTLAAWVAVSGLGAAEYHGTVKANGLPYPGVTVTAIQADTRIVTTTGDHGTFRFAELSDGTWTIEIRMLGFEPVRREVSVSAGAPEPEWELKFLSESVLAAGLGIQPVRTAPLPAAGKGGGRGGPAGGFQRLDVSQQADNSTLASQGTMKSDEIADLTQTSASSFLVQGSIGSAQGIGAQNDWGPPMGMTMGMESGGGRGGTMGGDALMGTNGDGPPGGAAGMAGIAGGGGRSDPGGGGPPGGGFGGGPGGTWWRPRVVAAGSRGAPEGQSEGLTPVATEKPGQPSIAFRCQI